MKAKISFMHGPHDLRIHDVELPEIRSDQILVKVGAYIFIILFRGCDWII
jgi:NADPH:quinone reductase-like Zn-dependent oxidoreductase